MKTTVLLGAHMSIEGGVHRAIERGESIGCTALQMFVKNSTQWKAKPLDDEQAETYKKALSKSNVRSVVVHSTYLINLCAKTPQTLHASRWTYTDELKRCEKLGIPYYNFHPGSHMGQGEEDGIRLIAESLNTIHEQTSGFKVKSVLETTAGQGTAVGYRFEHLRNIIDLVEQQDRMAVCIDTCHVFAAGYDFRTEKGYKAMIKEFDDVIGLDRLAAFHLNDSKKGCGSRIDRHEHIGKGEIGLEGFRFIMNDTRFANIPKIIETEKGDDMKEDVKNMNTLKGLIEK